MIRARRIRWLAAIFAVVSGTVLAMSLPGSAAVQTASPAAHLGMTWVVRSRTPVGVVNVGADSQTNAYIGDTAATESLPILCLYVDNSPVPAGIALDVYNGWARGWVALTPAVPGTAMTSSTAADGICAAYFGSGWRMAEHHDGWYNGQPTGWHFWAYGVIPLNVTRFWVAINDQPANPWS